MVNSNRRGGSFKYFTEAYITAPIKWNATADEVAAAINAVSPTRVTVMASTGPDGPSFQVTDTGVRHDVQ